MAHPIYWIGVRESEIVCTGKMFKGSITIYGNNRENNFAFDKTYGYRFDCNIDNEEWIDFVNHSGKQIIKNDPECQFMLYYPPDFPYLSQEIQTRTLYTNDNEIIALLENKIRARLWLSGCVPLPPFLVLAGCEINFDFLNKRFPRTTDFVIQADSSCSGNGTWLLTERTKNDVLDRLSASHSYTVSPYIRESIPINIHLIVYQEDVVLLPSSIQIISNYSSCLSYKGADFISYRQLSDEIRKKVTEYAFAIGSRLSTAGYRGVCGIDFILTEDEAYFMEVNSRFQGSTKCINQALELANKSISVQHLHRDAFINQSCSFAIPKFDINLSFYSYSYREIDVARIMFLHNAKKECADFVTCIDDNLEWDMEFHENSYMFELVFHRNIVAIGAENTCIVHPNIDMFSGIIDINNWKDQLLALKIMLFNHGVRISERAQRKLLNMGGFNYKEFSAVDISVQGLYISVPYSTQMSRLSPFEIDICNDTEYTLNYLGDLISPITIRQEDQVGFRLLKNGLRFNEITYLGSDRLRVSHRHSCFYKAIDNKCKFCDIEKSDQQFTVADIKYVIDNYAEHTAIRHYLIGGGSDEIDSDFSKIIAIAEYIKDKTNKPIYVMSTPPRNLQILHELFKAGVTEVAFNLEIFDRNLAREFMPGKGAIPLQVYEDAFKQAVALWGSDGNVRTSFIVGLEPQKSLIKGVEFACEMGVSPILSLFKPIEGTPLENMLPPSNSDVLKVCLEIEAICSKYGTALGPMCEYCEDNVLKIARQHIQ